MEDRGWIGFHHADRHPRKGHSLQPKSGLRLTLDPLGWQDATELFCRTVHSPDASPYFRLVYHNFEFSVFKARLPLILTLTLTLIHPAALLWALTGLVTPIASPEACSACCSSGAGPACATSAI